MRHEMSFLVRCNATRDASSGIPKTRVDAADSKTVAVVGANEGKSITNKRQLFVIGDNVFALTHVSNGQG